MEDITKQVSDKIKGWVRTFAGTMPQSELLAEFKIPYLEEDQLNQVREERLALALAAEIDENEPIWTDYEYEETQTKLDLGDLVLSHLCEETFVLLDLLESRFETAPIPIQRLIME